MPSPVVFLLHLLSSPLHAATLAAHDSQGLRDAIAQAVDGDVIVLSGGKYEAIRVDVPLEVTLRPAGAVAVQLGGLSVRSGARVVVEDLTITRASRAVTVENAALTLARVALTDVGSPDSGWAIMASGEGAVLTLSEVTVSQVRSAQGAVQLHGGARAEVTDSSFSGCTGGGALALYDGAVGIRGGDFSDNQGLAGGALHLARGQATLEGVRLYRNLATRGGSVYVGTEGELEATETFWFQGEASTGGQLLVDGGSARLVRAGFVEGRADYGGGVAVLGGSLEARNTTWGYAYADVGGALFIDGGDATVDLRHALFFENAASVGSAVAVQAGAASLSRSILAGNAGAEALASASSQPMLVAESLFWRNASAWEGEVIAAGTTDGAPLFTDGAAGDFTLRAGSAGLDYAAGADLDGTPTDLGIFGGPDAFPLPDEDGDGFARGRDCDDVDPTIHEGGVDLWYDGVDANCDGGDDFDQDGDGFPHGAVVGGDCVDTDAAIFPGQLDGQDGLDSNCDGFDLSDADGDGWPEDMDCDDADARTAPDAEETWYDGVDGDCSGGSDLDADLDGHDSSLFGGDDCDDDNFLAHPDVPEVPGDGVDQDCDGADLPEEGTDPGEPLEGEEIGGGDDDEAGADDEPGWVVVGEAQVTAGCSTTAAGRTSAGSLWGMLVGMVGLTALRRRRHSPAR